MSSKDKASETDALELMIMLAKKKPILTTFFIFLALYGLGMCFFGGSVEV